MDFDVLILGNDINTYYMERCFHELYHKKVNVMARRGIGVITYSNIINLTIVPDFDKPDIFVKSLNEYAEKNEHERILLIGTSDVLVRLIVENKDNLNKKFVYNYPNLEIVNNVLLKDQFYENFKNFGLEMPKTYIYTCRKNEVIDDSTLADFMFPLILKPGNYIKYHEKEFEGMSKVFKISSKQELLDVIQKIESTGYDDKLVIQEFIPGDDCALYDSIFYCGTDKKVKLMTFAQIGLQERNSMGVGNCTLLVNGFDEHGYKEEIVYKLKEFMEKIGYQGFAEFDLKYDHRDGKYKVLEINPRQARSSYYVCACGHNLVKYLIDDVIYNKEIPFTLVKEKMVLSFVPKRVIKKYVTSEKLKNEILSLIKKGKIADPLKYPGDKNLKRKLFLFLRDLNYSRKYKKFYW